jgi:hypothetical protein
LYSAFYGYEGTLDDALKSCSPLHLVGKLPKIKYTIFHCDNDKAVSLEKHSVPFVEAMKDSYDVDLTVVHGRGHCDLSAEAHLEYKKTIYRIFE